ncbi:2-C-methyl-D-erythritol 4-phosphate cytidylyltransferase [Bacteroidaceae bacterium HV4-6-C5C]|nr:2-C-methyl-D-erythritol 4-phosphate cytidylyltransferase [Bacteroidaceae bacterium HV4-6-C5C]
MMQYVLIVAGGKGLRMNNELPKQFITLKGKTILMYTLEAFYTYNPDIRIILVLPSTQRDYWSRLCKELHFSLPHMIVDGGENRFHSVKNGLAMVKKPGLVAVHDGVRPFVSQTVISHCFEMAQQKRAVIPVLDSIDTIRQLVDGGSVTVDRNIYKMVQTPQVFESELLQEAYCQEYNTSFTDDASVVEAMGVPVFLVPGNRENIKITTPFDLKIATALLE